MIEHLVVVKYGAGIHYIKIAYEQELDFDTMVIRAAAEAKENNIRVDYFFDPKTDAWISWTNWSLNLAFEVIPIAENERRYCSYATGYRTKKKEIDYMAITKSMFG